MSPAQEQRLRSIQDEIRSARRHPSATFRAKFDRFTEDEIAHAVDDIAMTLGEGDGYRAHKYIGIWHAEGAAAVVRHIVALTFHAKQPEKTTEGLPF